MPRPGCSTSSTARIEHILVDEAQDTSPDQWAVVQAIAEDFFSGDGAAEGTAHDLRGRRRQAVDLRLPGRGAAHAGRDARASSSAAARGGRSARRAARWRSPSARRARCSTRSTRCSPRARREDHGLRLRGACGASRREPGHVVVMPRMVRAKVEEPEDWTEPFDAPSAAETELAGPIADEIERLIGHAAALRQARRARRDPDPGAQARRLRRGHEPGAAQRGRFRRPARTAFRSRRTSPCSTCWRLPT